MEYDLIIETNAVQYHYVTIETDYARTRLVRKKFIVPGKINNVSSYSPSSLMFIFGNLDKSEQELLKELLSKYSKMITFGNNITRWC